ncbi:MAG TPA: gamma-glutamyltransferase family protein [Rhizomicrobium sp.]|nr:gamma-glutamyltransferase family protein [Rhizomicrobium sp.]
MPTKSTTKSTRAFAAASTEDVTFYPRMFGRRGAVAAEHYSAALAGIEILRAGGNAVDAACAATLVEGVVNPQMHTIGGELPILISTPDSREVVCINGNMTAPGKATPQAFRDLGHDAIPAEGVLAAGVPGALGAIVEALSRFGRLRFADVSARAIELAKDGFPAHSGLIRQHKSGITANFEKFSHWPGTAGVYLPGGKIPLEGELIRNPALAEMYLHLVKAERAAGNDRQAGLRAVFDAFYKGDIAAEIVRFVRERGGLLEASDFCRFRIPVEPSAHVEYAGAEIHKCGPWNQGPALLQSLTILKNFDLRAMGHNSADYIHTVLEAIKLAFADREQYYGDPDQVMVPLAALLRDDYGAMRARLIGETANCEIRPGDPGRNAALLPAGQRLGGAAWGPGTVHVDAMDAEGFTAAFTPSGGWIRASEVIPALGFALSMRLSNCCLAPAHHPNIVAPFKRPRTTISPSLVMKDGKAWMAFGSMGGDQQDQWQLQFLLNRLVFGMPLQQAIEAPKFSSEHFPGTFAPHDFFLNRVRIESSIASPVQDGLRARGHELDLAPAWSEGFLCAAERHADKGVLEAGCDPRGTKSEVFPACALAI